MKPKSIKIIDCFNVTGIGLFTEVQHSEDGIPPNTKLINTKTGESWTIKKRVLSGTLLGNDAEVYFDCETASMKKSSSFKSDKDREAAVEKEIEKRKNGIYSYLLKHENKKQIVKPEVGSVLKIAEPALQ